MISASKVTTLSRPSKLPSLYSIILGACARRLIVVKIYYMNITLRRYSDPMLIALAQQSGPSIILNALIRGVIFTLILEVIALASNLVVSNLIQMLILAVVFAFLVFSVDIIEKYWAQNRLNSRNQNRS
jgi:glycerol uptake facilitator-like aquaporin